MVLSRRILVIVCLFCVLLMLQSAQKIDADPPAALRLDDTASGPYVDKLLYKIIPIEDQQILALQDGALDILDRIISPSYIPVLSANPDIEVSSIPRNGYGRIIINCRDAPLNWTVLRRAFAFAYDKYRVRTEVFGGLSQVHDSLVPYVNDLFCIENEFLYDYYESNVVLGNALLDAAGFAVDGMTGYRNDPNGNPIHIVIAYSPTSTAIAGACAEIGADALRALSIDAVISAQDFNTFLANMNNHGSFDMIVTTTNFDNNDVDWLAYDYWSDNAEVPYQNPSNFVNDTYDSCRDQLLHGITYEEVHNASSWMQKILHYNVPVLVVYEDLLYSAYRTDRFEGFIVDNYKNVANEWTNIKAHLELTEGGPFSDTLQLSLRQEPDSFNPMISSSQYSKVLFDNMFSSLLRMGPDGQMRPDLAESYLIETHGTNSDVPTGHTRFTFDIIQNASWTDGTPLTADDIAYSFNYYLNSAAYGNPTAFRFPDISSIFSPTPSRVVIEFSSESYWHLSSIADVFILQKTLLESIGFSGWYAWDPIISSDPYPTSGPFNITDFALGEYFGLSYHPYYHHRVRGTGSDKPIIDILADFAVVQSPHMGDLTWNVVDDDPLIYRIYHNGTLMDVSYYGHSPIRLSLDGYDLGQHTFDLEVLDYEYQIATASVNIDVIVDTFSPEITGPNLVVLDEGATSGIVINWSVFDDNPSNYTLDVNGTEVVSTTWDWGTEEISYTLEALHIANYTYTLIVRDTYGHSSSWSILVCVKERPLSFPLETLILIGGGAAVVVVVVSVVIKKQR
jgi:ABC-type transport system substrate-binding protein